MSFTLKLIYRANIGFFPRVGIIGIGDEILILILDLSIK